MDESDHGDAFLPSQDGESSAKELAARGSYEAPLSEGSRPDAMSPTSERTEAWFTPTGPSSRVTDYFTPYSTPPSRKYPAGSTGPTKIIQQRPGPRRASVSPRMSRHNSQENLNGDPLPTIPREHIGRVKMLDHETDGIEYLCVECGFRTFERELFLFDHLPHHGKRAKHTCVHCSFASNDYKLVNEHFRNHKIFIAKGGLLGSEKRDLLLRCRHCPFETIFPEDYNDHILCHNDKQRYHCSLCTFCANDQAKVIEHEGLHYRQKPLFLDGLAPSQKKYYLVGKDRKPHFLESDFLAKKKKVVQKEKLSESKKVDLRRILAGLVDPTEIK